MRLARLRPTELDDDQAALYGEITRGPRSTGPQHFALTESDGSLNGPFNAFLYAPGVARSLQALGSVIRFETDLTTREREMAILVVAAHWKSLFERESHEAVGLASGLTEAEVASIREGDVPGLADAHENAVVRATHSMARGDLDDAQWEEARHFLTPRTIVELSTLVGYYATLALQLRIFGVDEMDK